jgi:hypothetical protein
MKVRPWFFCLCIASSAISSCHRRRLAPAPAADGGDIAPDARKPARVVAGARHACAWLDGRVFCWGENVAEQLGVATTDELIETRPAIGQPVVKRVAYSARARRLDLPRVEQVVAGDAHTCALTSDDGVYCWGTDLSGESSATPGPNRLSPYRLESLSRTVQLSSSDHVTCARAGDGSVSCWGMSIPGVERVKGVDHVARVVEQSGGTYFIRQDRSLWWVGRNPSWGDVKTPSRAPVVGVVRDAWVDARRRGCFEGEDDVYCWWIEPGDATADLLTGVTKVPWLRGTRRIAMGLDGYCAINESNGVRCWHSSDVEIDPKLKSASAREIALDDDVQDVAVGDDFACAVTRHGIVWCWGHNEHGQLGDGTLVSRAEPRRVPIDDHDLQ